MRRILPLALLVVTVGATVAGMGTGDEDAGSASSGAESAAGERLLRNEDIHFFERRVARDPTGAQDLVRLGALYQQRFRETGDESDLIAAERAARRSYGNRARHNEAALQLLAAALLGQHRFLEAQEAARAAVAANPDAATARAALGEIQLELGAYPEADSIFRRLTPQQYTLSVAPRYARWLELRGHAMKARRLLEWAASEADRTDGTPREQRAWYQLRLGELAFRFGAHREAGKRLDQGLALVPDDWRLLSARARLSLATADFAVAIALGDSALALHLDPTTLATVGDAWLARGDPAKAEEYHRAMEASAQAPRGGFHRAWYLALLDHDRRVPEVLEAVTRDLLSRPDVYGYDLLAWALFKSGRPEESRRAMAKALEWGTEDPQIHAHARAIGAAR